MQKHAFVTADLPLVIIAFIASSAVPALLLLLLLEATMMTITLVMLIRMCDDYAAWVKNSQQAKPTLACSGNNVLPQEN